MAQAVALQQEFERVLAGFSPPPPLPSSVVVEEGADILAAMGRDLRRFRVRMGAWRSDMLTNVARLRKIFEQARADGHEEVVRYLVEVATPEILTATAAMVEMAEERALWPPEFEAKLELARRLHPSAERIGRQIRKSYVTAAKEFRDVVVDLHYRVLGLAAEYDVDAHTVVATLKSPEDVETYFASLLKA